ncbi:hypothetical protein AB1Y20_016803 [Prymnesium parvum]|uniref:Major facilitator superfamily (MFS) profile domain-containing protein n=1 Tax=Prymnesium parvum TaxID=97485 RepID=A0AB34IB50_PRYPA
MRWPWSSPPPPPPPPPPPLSSTALPTLAAVSTCWLFPALLFLRTRSPARKPAREAGEAAKRTPAVHKGVLLGSLMSFLSVTGAAVTFPYVQTRRDQLGCDALCQGGQTSLRSALSLVGAALVGRASDQFGRIPMLWVGFAASLTSLSINARMDSIDGMWLAIVPVALLNQNFSVIKALFSDYIEEQGGGDAERAGAMGKLGMAVGFSFMAGPVVATALVADYMTAIHLSIGITLLSGTLLFLLPTPATQAQLQPKAGARGGIMEFIQLPVLKSPGAKVLMSMRLLMALAFHMFVPVWQISIKERFAFQPKDHAQET